MPEINFQVLSAKVKPFAAAPTLVFELQVTNRTPGEEVFAAALRCQILIEATKRTYDDEVKSSPSDVFGEPSLSEQTVRSLYWVTVNIAVPRFRGLTVIEVPISCYNDHVVAAGKYLNAVGNGDIPLAFLFSGSIFYSGGGGSVLVMQLPREKEAFFRMPAALWQEMMAIYFPNSTWLAVRNETYTRLRQLTRSGAYPTLDNCLEAIVEKAFQELRVMAD